ncbi:MULTISPECIES: monooxygenase [unclassified Luteococcus]|uniref:monooxygenase n=1 Tax=unclassified Luteococcus TaxID=2639923 RepID=UPI00313DAD79
MAVLVQMNFAHHGPWGSEMSDGFRELASTINDEPGFLWKVWIEDQPGELSGGIYVFDSRQHAEAYVAMHRERMAGFGVTAIEVHFFDVNEPLSILNRATLAGC